MRRGVAGIAILALSMVSVVALWAQEKKNPPTRKDPPAPIVKDKKEARDKFLASGRIVGKLLHVEGAQRYFTVQVTYRVPQQNLGEAQAVANVRLQMADAYRRGDANAVRSNALELARHQQNLISYHEEHQNIELQADDDMKVRTLLTPVEYDDKGKPRRLSEKEKKELRGPDPSLPGYTADFDSLKQDQIVEVYLAKSKDQPRPRVRDKDGPPEKHRPRAVMIVIRYEPPK
jgi:hypothetical protein